jgi:hypothetical protein
VRIYPAVTGKGTDTISGHSTLEFEARVSSAQTIGDQDIDFDGAGTLPSLIVSAPPIVSDADAPSSLSVAFASEKVSEFATSAVSTVTVSVAEPLIVAESEAVGTLPQASSRSLNSSRR